MAFWDAVDRFVGYILVTSTVKDAIEAGIAEAKGRHGAAKEEVIEAAVIIVSDLVTMTAFGASAEVATAGVIAAEGIFKQAAKGLVQNVAAEATSLGSGRKADEDVTAVAFTQYAREIVVFEEAKGHAAGAAKEVSEAGVIRVSDLVSVAAFGASEDVVEAGKTAVEWFLKHAVKSDEKTAEEARFLGSGTNAADVVLTAAAASQYARTIILSEKSLKPVKPSSKKLPEESKRGHLVTQASRKPSKEPKRGHHVINNGVIKIIPDIIKGFLEEFKDKIFLKNSYQELVEQNIITLGATPKLMLMLNGDEPWPEGVCAQIEQMVASTPEGETHTDQNDEKFGAFKAALIKDVVGIVLRVFNSLEGPGVEQDLSEKMQSLIELINSATVGQKEYYVDRQALKWWLDETGHQMEQFTACRDEVKNMFDSLVCVEKQYDCTAGILGREIFDIYKRLIKSYNLQPQLVCNPVDYVRNKGQPTPHNAVKLGCEKDQFGENYSLYSAVALSRWGAIPGKAKGNTCWFSYEGKEYPTDNFVWLTSMRELQMKKNKGSPPKLAVLCARNGTAWYAAIAMTSWGKIPGKAKDSTIPGKAEDSTCFYPYNGKEYSTKEFCWLVRAKPQKENSCSRKHLKDSQLF